MTIVQFITAMDKYSIDVLLLAFLVCFATSIVKKLIPANLKKYITFIPFVLGIAVYACFLVINKTEESIVISSQTLTKGFECGAAATIYYVLYEQFIRGKTTLASSTDVKQIIVAEILKGLVLASKLFEVSAYLSQKISENLSDPSYCVTLCVNAVSGKTQAGVNDNDIYAAAKLINKTLATFK